jgi:hypothetical protein
VFSLIITSIRASRWDGFFGTKSTALFITSWVVPVIALFWIAFWARRWQKGMLSAEGQVPLVLALTVCSLLMAHFLFKVNYPSDRTGLYLIPLAGMTWAATSDRLRNPFIRMINVVLACALLIQFATQIQFRSFEIWWYNSAIKDIARKLQHETIGKSVQSVSVSADFFQQPALEFYRLYYGIAALKPVERKLHADFTGHDFYVLTGPETRTPQAAQLTVVFSDAASDVVLAR